MSRHTIPITNGKGSIELVTGTIVGKEITTNDDGNAVFENVSYV